MALFENDFFTLLIQQDLSLKRESVLVPDAHGLSVEQDKRSELANTFLTASSESHIGLNLLDLEPSVSKSVNQLPNLFVLRSGHVPYLDLLSITDDKSLIRQELALDTRKFR